MRARRDPARRPCYYRGSLASTASEEIEHARTTQGVDIGFFGFLILGLIAGAIAKAILPGKQGGGWLMTLLLGVVGAILGGWIGGLVFGGNTLGSFFEIRTWVTAIVGSLIVLLIWGALTKRRA